MKEYFEDKYIVFIFENGKGVRVPLSAYETKGNRKKLTGAYSQNSPIAAVLYEDAPFDMLILDSSNKAILINSSLIPIKTTRNSQGVTVFSLKKGCKVVGAIKNFAGKSSGGKSLRKTKIPATGVSYGEYELSENQIKLI